MSDDIDEIRDIQTDSNFNSIDNSVTNCVTTNHMEPLSINNNIHNNSYGKMTE